jgi:hypothetical protein
MRVTALCRVVEEVEMRLRLQRDRIAIAAGLLAPLAVAALLVPFRASFAGPAAALVLVAVVVAVAANGNRTAGGLAAVSAAVWFDFFLTEPYERFAISHRPDIETAVSLLIVGIAVTELAARGRHHHSVASEESSYLSLISELSDLVAGGSPSGAVVDRASECLVEVLALRACRYEGGPPQPGVIRLDREGHVTLGAVRWGVDTAGLPGKELELPVQARGRVLGRFVLTPAPGTPVSLQRRIVALAIADQVGASLTPHLRSA